MPKKHDKQKVDVAQSITYEQQRLQNFLKYLDDHTYNPSLNTTNRKYNVGKMLTLLNYDELFEKSENAKIINNSLFMSQHIAEEINNAIFSNNDGELAFTATCECQFLKGNYYIGAICPMCHTKVSTAFADKLSHICWIAVPDDLPPVMHPIVYLVLRKWSVFKINQDPLIDILLNPNAELPQELKDVFPNQGFHYVYNNFSYIMDVLLNKYPKTATKTSTKLVKMFLIRYKNLIFCRKLPILHNSLHVMTKSGVVKYIDNSVKDALKAALDITHTSYSLKRNVVYDKFADVSLYNSYKGYVNYINSIGQNKLGDKYALFRHHILGCRCHWSCRSVIVPHIEPRDADELIMPWNIMVQSLKLEILNRLVSKYNIDPNDAIYRHNKSFSQYDPIIAEIMNDLIKECPYKGLPLIFGRNPSLQHGAMQLFFITKFKTNIDDESISISPLVLSAPNADFDGDELWGIFLKEMDSVKQFMSMHPSNTMLSKNTLTVSNTVTLMDQTRIMQNNWLISDPYYQSNSV